MKAAVWVWQKRCQGRKFNRTLCTDRNSALTKLPYCKSCSIWCNAVLDFKSTQKKGLKMSLVGIVANPASGTDIRRLVAYGSVFNNQENLNCPPSSAWSASCRRTPHWVYAGLLRDCGTGAGRFAS